MFYDVSVRSNFSVLSEILVIHFFLFFPLFQFKIDVDFFVYFLNFWHRSFILGTFLEPLGS